MEIRNMRTERPIFEVKVDIIWIVEVLLTDFL